VFDSVGAVIVIWTELGMDYGQPLGVDHNLKYLLMKATSDKISILVVINYCSAHGLGG
jgi:hypothetical protein